MSLLTKFRKTILFFLKVLVVATVTTAFVGVWQNFYREALFGGLGNYLVVLTYVVIFIVFCAIYDALKVGIMHVHELSYSMSLSVFFTNVFIYVILSLIARVMLNPIALIILTAIQVMIIVFSMYSLNNVYFALYKARSVLAIFDKSTRNDII